MQSLPFDQALTVADSALRHDDVLQHGLRTLVVEADSHTWHSSRAALRRDCRRYTSLTLRGWTVIRFAWEDVMFAPDYVRTSLESLAQGAAKRARPSPRRRSAA